MEKGEIYKYSGLENRGKPRALDGWSELEILETPGPEDEVVAVGFLNPVSWWADDATGLISIKAIDRYYKVQRPPVGRRPGGVDQ